MALKRVTGKIEVLELDGSEVHAIKPTKAIWDEYVDELFYRDKNGDLVTRSSRGYKALYRMCVKKLVNVEIEKDGEVQSGVTITDPDEIVAFLTGLTDLDAGRKIDNWLLSIGGLTPEEVKN